MPDDRYEIAYQEALRSIADQQTALDVLQSRASTVASAGAIATGLIGLGANGGGGMGPFGLVAIIFLLGIMVLSGLIIWPRREWRFHFTASSLHWNYIEGPGPVTGDLMRRDLALHLDVYFQSNAKKIDRFGVLLSLSIVPSLLRHRGCTLRDLEELSMSTNEEEQPSPETIEPGKPLRPDPGSPETRGGSRNNEKVENPPDNK